MTRDLGRLPRSEQGPRQAAVPCKTLRRTKSPGTWDLTRKNELFGVGRFERFLHKKRSGDEAVTSVVTSVFWTKKGRFGSFFGQKSQINWSLFLLLLARAPLPERRLPHSSTLSGTPGKAYAGCTRSLQQPCSFEPFDLDHNQAHDILDDAVDKALLKLCWSGIIALIMLAPPCKEYSRLKLRPGGPKALRTAAHEHRARPVALTVKEAAIHERGRALFIAVVSKGEFGNSRPLPCPGLK